MPVTVSSPKRVLIYSHDTFGLGHLRRCRTIAQALVANNQNTTVLILSGSPIIGQFDFGERVDFVRIPGVIKLKNGEYTSSNLNLAIDDAVALRAEGLVKRYRKRSVVKSVELEVRQGEIVGLLGPNGAGKTTTFYMIVGMIRPDGGRVLLGEEDMTGLPMYERARRGIGYLAQEASIFSHLSVEDNLSAVLEYQDLSRQERKERVEELISEFGLEKVRLAKGYTLSGGERRRTEIARALATRPRFFLLDEPFAGVDPIAVEDIQTIVSRLRERGIGVLITDHNVHETLAITDRAYLLYEGRILKQGTAESLAADPEVRRRYLGEKFRLERYR